MEGQRRNWSSAAAWQPGVPRCQSETKMARKRRGGIGSGPSRSSAFATICRHDEEMSRGGVIGQASAYVTGPEADRTSAQFSSSLVKGNGISLFERKMRDSTDATRRGDESFVTAG